MFFLLPCDMPWWVLFEIVTEFNCFGVHEYNESDLFHALDSLPLLPMGIL